MAHHGDGIPPEMKNVPPENLHDRLNELHNKLGATGQHPEGKITEDDEGEIRIAIGHTQGKIVIDFGEKPIKWIGFTPVQARQIAIALIEHADECMIVKA